MTSQDEFKTRNAQDEDDCFLTIHQAAELLQLAPGSLYHFVSQRRIPFTKLSLRCLRFSRRALLDWAHSLSQEPNPKSQQKASGKISSSASNAKCKEKK